MPWDAESQWTRTAYIWFATIVLFLLVSADLAITFSCPRSPPCLCTQKEDGTNTPLVAHSWAAGSRIPPHG